MSARSALHIPLVPSRRRSLRSAPLGPLVIGWLLLAWLTAPMPAVAVTFLVPVAADSDDGVEIDDATWDPDPPELAFGRTESGSFQDAALRFLLPDLAGIEEVAFARLRFNSKGGTITDSLVFVISAVAEIAPGCPSQELRPSMQVQTSHRVVCTIDCPWVEGVANPIFYYSPDISAILNELMARSDWPGDSAALVLCLEDSSEAGSPVNYLACSDFDGERAPVTLEICRTLDEAFDCHGLAGRPTAHSATINFRPLVDIDACLEYGSGLGWAATPLQTLAAGETCEILLDDLEPDTAYSYRLRYRRAGSAGDLATGEARGFRTQRPPGSPFTFTVQADPHLWSCWGRWPLDTREVLLYAKTLENVSADGPDFHVDLGDFAMSAFAETPEAAVERYALQRRFVDRALHSASFYEVLGNHEGELGWLAAANDSVPVWAERARHLLIPNPYPDGFYKGCADSACSGPGYRESYYAWEWGDALFVVLDPYWHTLERPHHNERVGKGGGWAWTLGQEQYEWLYSTLRRSDRKWKIVLTHQLIGGVDYGIDNYGRGGIEVAKFHVDFRPTYEWGGENRYGEEVFPYLRPGWTHGPIHDVLVLNGANLVIHGHDHLCALQQLDGITYALCPQPTDADYTYGALEYAAYSHGVILPNSGHLRFRVSSADILIDYVRSYLPGEGENGVIAATWSVANGFCAVPPPSADTPRLIISPNPTFGGSQVLFRALGAGGLDSRPGEGAPLRILDAAGRVCASPGRLRDGRLAWDLRGPDGPLPSGVYFCISGEDAEGERTRLVVAR